MSRNSSIFLLTWVTFALALSSPAQPDPSLPAHVSGPVTRLPQASSPSGNLPASTSGDSSVTMTAPEQLRRIEPPSPNAPAEQLEQTGDLLRARKFYADSVDYYRAALPKTEHADAIYNKIGISELLMLHWGEAKKNFEHALKANRSNAEAYNNLGVVFYEGRNYRKAIKYYDKAIRLDSNSASFHSNLGSAYFSRKEFEKANQQYAIALTLDPEVFERHSGAGISMHTTAEDRARFSYVIAKMYAKAGDSVKCLQYLRKALEEGFAVSQNFAKDREFDPFRRDSRFITLLGNKTARLPE